MGTWGARIYEDDTALDVRDDFLEQYHADTPVEEIEENILAEYIVDDYDEFDQSVYLALACVELETATLTDKTKRKALDEIATGPDPKLWGDLVGPRKREHTLVKKYLEAYDGKPVKRKSWVELQKGDEERLDFEPFPDNDEESVKLDDISWQVLEYEGADKLSEDEYLARAGAHVDCFVYWLIKCSYLRTYGDEAALDSLKVSEGKLSVMDYISQHMDLKLFSDNIVGSVRPFATWYYAEQYMDDYYKIVVRDRPELQFTPTKNDRETMAKQINTRFKEFQKDPALQAKATAKQKTESKREAIFNMILPIIGLTFWFMALYGIFCLVMWLWRLVF